MRKKGISLIVLVITVVVLIILTAVIILTINKNNIFESSREAKFKNDVMAFNEELNLYVMNKYMGLLGEYSRKTLNAENIEIAQNNILPIKDVVPSIMDSKVYLNKILVKEGKLTFSNLTEEEQKWLDEIQNLLNASNNDSGNTEGDSTDTYVQSLVNHPLIPTTNNLYSTKLGQGICAITFDENGKSEIVTDLSKEWYNYIPQTSTTPYGGTSKWANIQTKDGSQWVWIPRFAYKITKGAHTKVGYTETNNLGAGEAGTVEIKFLKGDTNEFFDGTGTAQTDPSQITYDEKGMQSDFLVHPGFLFNGKNQTGFWAAKYEASSVEGNGGSLSTDNFLNVKTLQVKPDVFSWTNIEAKNMFGNCIFMGTEHAETYGFKKNTNTHLMKNDEWGAIAYLTHSVYGRNGTKVSVNEDYKEDKVDSRTVYHFRTGGGGKLASSTGNYYGIFDIAGGASDAMAAKCTLEKSDFDIFGKDSDVSEYIDTYPEYKNLYKGDALYETSIRNNGTTSWFSSLSWPVNTSEPFMTRGGCAIDKDSASTFAFYRYKLEWYQLNKVSFRPTITLDRISNPNIAP